MSDVAEEQLPLLIVTCGNTLHSIDLKAENTPHTTLPLEHAGRWLQKNNCAGLVLIGRNVLPQLEEFLMTYLRLNGTNLSQMVLVSDKPSPDLLLLLNEFGLHDVVAFNDWNNHPSVYLSRLYDQYSSRKNAHDFIAGLCRAIVASDQDFLQAAGQGMEKVSLTHFERHFVSGILFENAGNLLSATEEYQNAIKLNDRFWPLAMALSENLLLVAKTKEAVAVLEAMERVNPKSLRRKALLTGAWLDQGEAEKARSFCEQAIAIDPDHTATLESKIYILLAEEKLTQAYQLIDRVQNAGMLFTARLNEIGIKLSKSGRGKESLALYEKIHRVVRPELRYKISLNAALACYRLRDFGLAQQFAAQCEAEFGAVFPKLQKVQDVLASQIGSALGVAS